LNKHISATHPLRRLPATLVLACLGALVVFGVVAAADETYNSTRTFDGCTTDVYAIVITGPGYDTSYAEHSDYSGTCAVLVAGKAWYYQSGWFQTAWGTGPDVGYGIVDASDEEHFAFGKGGFQTKVGTTWGPVTESPILYP
jgi:hypothetical protein